MTEDRESQDERRKLGGLGDGARFLLILAAAFIVIYGLQYARAILVPILMAAFLAVISYAITSALRSLLRFPHWLAVVFTVIVDAAIILGVVSLLRFLASDVTATLQSDVYQRFSDKYAEAMQTLDSWGVGDFARQFFSSPKDILDPQMIASLSLTISGQIVSFTSICVLVLVLMTFLLGEAPLFRRNLSRLGNSAAGKDKVLNALRGIQRYLLIKSVSSVCTGLLAWCLCAAMDIPFAFLWGVLAFVLNYIPTIGSIVAAIPPILLAMLLGTWGDTFVVAGGYLVINITIGNGIEPLFLGKQFGIATSVVLLSVLFWGWVWGSCGMLLAVPITVLIKLALENSRDLSWVASLIDSDASASSKNKN